MIGHTYGVSAVVDENPFVTKHGSKQIFETPYVDSMRRSTCKDLNRGAVPSSGCAGAAKDALIVRPSRSSLRSPKNRQKRPTTKGQTALLRICDAAGRAGDKFVRHQNGTVQDLLGSSPAKGGGRPTTRSTAPPYTSGCPPRNSRALPPFKTTLAAPAHVMR